MDFSSISFLDPALWGKLLEIIALNIVLSGDNAVVIALAMMLFGVSSRMIGDFIPKILITHYNYGALCWGIGLLVWAWKVIPNVLTPDPDP